jgi:hypothetical protein
MGILEKLKAEPKIERIEPGFPSLKFRPSFITLKIFNETHFMLIA